MKRVDLKTRTLSSKIEFEQVTFTSNLLHVILRKVKFARETAVT